MTRFTLNAIAVAVVLGAAGCGGDDNDSGGSAKKPATTITEGAVFYSDPLDDNKNGWLTVEGLVSFKGGEYIWLETPDGGGFSQPDTLIDKKPPAGLAVSIDVEMTSGAAHRGLTCFEKDVPGEDELDQWYELGIDGRRALIRRMDRRAEPKVLASPEVPVENGRRVRLTARCVRDGEAAALSLLVDGKQVASARDDTAISGGSDLTEVYGYRRPDSEGSADMVWDDFEIREAKLAS